MDNLMINTKTLGVITIMVIAPTISIGNTFKYGIQGEQPDNSFCPASDGKCLCEVKESTDEGVSISCSGPGVKQDSPLYYKPWLLKYRPAQLPTKVTTQHTIVLSPENGFTLNYICNQEPGWTLIVVSFDIETRYVLGCGYKPGD